MNLYIFIWVIVVLIVVSDKINNKLISNKKIIFLESPCNIKTIEEKDNYLFIDESINIKEDGYFYNSFDNDSLINQISLDELLIMTDIKLIIVNNDSDKVKEISDFFNVDYIVLK